MNADIKKGTYQHYKGGLARVIDIAKNTETLEEYVAYYHEEKESGKEILWVRPKTMFLEEIEINGTKLPRFKFISEEE